MMMETINNFVVVDFIGIPIMMPVIAHKIRAIVASI